jgi:hypothetical protein
MEYQLVFKHALIKVSKDKKAHCHIQAADGCVQKEVPE